LAEDRLQTGDLARKDDCVVLRKTSVILSRSRIAAVTACYRRRETTV
jgi:hypothetical protein